MNPPFDPKGFLDIPDPFPPNDGTRLQLPNVDAFPLAPTRSRTWARRVGALGTAIACEALLVGIMGVRDFTNLNSGVVGYGILFPFVSATFVLGVIQKSTLRRASIPAAFAVGVFTFAVTTFLSRAPGDESVSGIVRCLIGGSMMATSPVLLAIFSMRHAFATGATWRTALLGLASGLIGAASTRLYCPDDAFAHVLIGHGAPILLVVLAATALGPRFTRA